MSGILDMFNPVSQAKKGASTFTFVILMLLAIIFIAIGLGLLGSWNIMSGMILLLVGGGLGFVGYTLKYGSTAGAAEYDNDDSEEDSYEIGD